MSRVIPALFLALVATPSFAQQAAEQPAPEVQPIFRAGDAAMTCRQISDEAAELSAQMGDSQGGGVFSSVVGVGRAGASALIPGAGLAIAGVDALNRPERERREAREAAVEQRWYYLNGLYTGVRCGQPTASDTPRP